MVIWKNEDSVNNWVNEQLSLIGLKRDIDFKTELNISNYMKRSLYGSAKTAKEINFEKPDVYTNKYNIPVIIKNKIKSAKLVAKTKNGIKQNDKAIERYAVNNALYYARNMISSGKYKEVVAIGVAGDSPEKIFIKVYYVFGFGESSYKELSEINSFDFLENKNTFTDFYEKAILNNEEKHEILIQSQIKLQKYAEKLNKLMHDHNITAPQRILYVSGMLLSMQNGKNIRGLNPEDLKGKIGKQADGVIVVNQIEEFLKAKKISEKNRNLMLASFKEISKDTDREVPTLLDKEVIALLKDEASVTKQIFTFIYENIFKSIDGIAGTLDVMGEMYSIFLKYALGDGREIGIVLTPPYVTKMMAQLLNITKDSHVMDLATGSAGFLIASMELMIDDAKKVNKNVCEITKKVKKIKHEQLLGIELNAEMFTLASTNMILRGDESSIIQKSSSFNLSEKVYKDFKADRLLLNPPFSYDENGMPFVAFGLDKMKKGGLGAIIIQDSVGSGKAIETNKAILTKHTLKASIKMPIDLFIPMASVQTSIYIFQAGVPHDFEKTVRFIDFRNDGYKRAQRSLIEIDNPTQRYSDIVKIYKAGNKAKTSANWELKDVLVDDFIDESGADWNFDQHKKIDIKPTEQDFKKVVSDYLVWEVSQLLKNENQNFR